MPDEKKQNPGGKGELFVDFLAALLGGLEPERRELGVRTARRVPEGHWLRRESVRRAISALNQWLERRGGIFLGAVGGQIYERLISDVVDSILQELGADKQKEAATTIPPWFPDWLKEALEDIATAPDPEAAKEERLRQFKVRMEFERTVKEELKPPTPAAPQREPVDWSKRRENLRQKTQGTTKRWADRLGEVADRLEQGGQQ